MKKIIQEFRIALQFGVKRKDDSMQELRKAYDNQCKLIHEFFEQFDYIEKQEVESQNLSACICFCSGNEHAEQEIKRQYQKKIDELDKRSQYLKDLDALTQKHQDEKNKISFFKMYFSNLSNACENFNAELAQSVFNLLKSESDKNFERKEKEMQEKFNAELGRKLLEKEVKLPNIFKDQKNYFNNSCAHSFYNKYKQEKEKCQCIKYFNGVSFTNLWECDKCKNENNPLYEKKIENELKKQHVCEFKTIDKMEFNKEWILLKSCNCGKLQKITIDKEYLKPIIIDFLN